MLSGSGIMHRFSVDTLGLCAMADNHAFTCLIFLDVTTGKLTNLLLLEQPGDAHATPFGGIQPGSAEFTPGLEIVQEIEGKSCTPPESLFDNKL